MFGITNFIIDRLLILDLNQPLVFIDLLLSLFLVVGFLVYLHRFPVFRVVIGILFLIGCAALFYSGGFFFTALVFGIAANIILISLPFIFAPEIRHYLEKLGRLPFLKIPHITTYQKKTEFIHNLTDTVFELASRNIGGTLVLMRKTGLGETIETGVIIDAKFGSKLLQTILYPKTPLHDGAVILKDNRIIAASCLLPIHPEVKLDQPFGTRHVSGLSITKDTDAVSIIISEERGEVSIAENGKFYPNVDRPEFIQKITGLYG